MAVSVRPAAVTALAVVVCAIGALTLTAAPAFAHAELVRSDPANGAHLHGLPAQVTLTFSETVATPVTVAVLGPDGHDLADGSATIVDETVTQPLAAVDPVRGDYKINYEVTSADGHPVQGRLAFTLAGKGFASPSGPAQTASTTTQSGSDLGDHVGWVVALVLALAAGLGVLVVALDRMVRQSSAGTP